MIIDGRQLKKNVINFDNSLKEIYGDMPEFHLDDSSYHFAEAGKQIILESDLSNLDELDIETEEVDYVLQNI